ncbi:hypothetical protein BC829DRAFT_443656 [Chytridium lagenaria]|nr:hypothetical protein BC829DRAFT_443656 [Chytridium lagenaria]
MMVTFHPKPSLSSHDFSQRPPQDQVTGDLSSQGVHSRAAERTMRRPSRIKNAIRLPRERRRPERPSQQQVIEISSFQVIHSKTSNEANDATTSRIKDAVSRGGWGGCGGRGTTPFIRDTASRERRRPERPSQQQVIEISSFQVIYSKTSNEANDATRSRIKDAVSKGLLGWWRWAGHHPIYSRCIRFPRERRRPERPSKQQVIEIPLYQVIQSKMSGEANDATRSRIKDAVLRVAGVVVVGGAPPHIFAVHTTATRTVSTTTSYRNPFFQVIHSKTSGGANDATTTRIKDAVLTGGWGGGGGRGTTPFIRGAFIRRRPERPSQQQVIEIPLFQVIHSKMSSEANDATRSRIKNAISEGWLGWLRWAGHHSINSRCIRLPRERRRPERSPQQQVIEISSFQVIYSKTSNEANDATRSRIKNAISERYGFLENDGDLNGSTTTSYRNLVISSYLLENEQRSERCDEVKDQGCGFEGVVGVVAVGGAPPHLFAIRIPRERRRPERPSQQHLIEIRHSKLSSRKRAAKRTVRRRQGLRMQFRGVAGVVAVGGAPPHLFAIQLPRERRRPERPSQQQVIEISSFQVIHSKTSNEANDATTSRIKDAVSRGGWGGCGGRGTTPFIRGAYDGDLNGLPTTSYRNPVIPSYPLENEQRSERCDEVKDQEAISEGWLGWLRWARAPPHYSRYGFLENDGDLNGLHNNKLSNPSFQVIHSKTSNEANDATTVKDQGCGFEGWLGWCGGRGTTPFIQRYGFLKNDGDLNGLPTTSYRNPSFQVIHSKTSNEANDATSQGSRMRFRRGCWGGGGGRDTTPFIRGAYGFLEERRRPERPPNNKLSKSVIPSYPLENERRKRTMRRRSRIKDAVSRGGWGGCGGRGTTPLFAIRLPQERRRPERPPNNKLSKSRHSKLFTRKRAEANDATRSRIKDAVSKGLLGWWRWAGHHPFIRGAYGFLKNDGDLNGLPNNKLSKSVIPSYLLENERRSERCDEVKDQGCGFEGVVGVVAVGGTPPHLFAIRLPENDGDLNGSTTTSYRNPSFQVIYSKMSGGANGATTSRIKNAVSEGGWGGCGGRGTTPLIRGAFIRLPQNDGDLNGLHNNKLSKSVIPSYPLENERSERCDDVKDQGCGFEGVVGVVAVGGTPPHLFAIRLPRERRRPERPSQQQVIEIRHSKLSTRKRAASERCDESRIKDAVSKGLLGWWRWAGHHPLFAIRLPQNDGDLNGLHNNNNEANDATTSRIKDAVSKGLLGWWRWAGHHPINSRCVPDSSFFS